jgi:arylsulfatase A-like enzyme
VAGLLPRPVVQDNGRLLDSLYAAVMPGTNPVPADIAQKVVDQYDTALRNLDTGIGDLIGHLKELGVYDNTVFVVTSDHGEFFGEHLLVEHSKDIYEEVVSVPLIIKFPGQTEGAIENTIVSATDLPHLVLSAFEGEPWVSHLADFPDSPGNHEIVSEIYYTRTKDLFHPVWGHRFNRVRTAIYDWPWKYISSSDNKNELYNLETDRAEAVNLIESDETTAARLSARLYEFLEKRGRSDERVDQKPLSEEERRRLRSLGYIGD